MWQRKKDDEGKRGQNKSLQDKEECAGREEQVEL